MGGFEAASRRDRWAYAALVAFVVQVYAVPGEWIPLFAPLRLAFVLSTLAAVLLAVRSLARVEPIYLDGLRGYSLLALAVIVAASASWSVSPEVTRVWTVEFLKLVAIYLTVVNVVTTPRRLAYICGVWVLASIVTSIGVIQWYHNGVDLVEGFRARWWGVYADPNHMAANLGIVVPLATAFLVRRRTPLLMRILCALAGALACVSIVESHSRGGFIGLSAAMGLWALRERQARVLAISTGALLFLGLIIFAPKSFWDRADTLENFHEDASAMGRVYAWHVASAISLDKPLIGVGAGGFRYAWPEYGPPEAKQAYVAHNIYLDMIGELGWPALFLFLMFSGGATGGAFAASVDERLGWLARGLSAAMVGYLLCNCFSGYALSAHLYLLFALAACAERITKARRQVQSLPGPGSGGLGSYVPVPVPVRAFNGEV